MLDYLAQPDVIDTLRAGEHDGDRELSEVRDRLAAVRARHEQLADAVAAGTVSVTTLVRAEPPLLAEITTRWQPGALRDDQGGSPLDPRSTQPRSPALDLRRDPGFAVCC